MIKKRWLALLLYAILLNQGLFAQTSVKKVLGIDEMFRMADEKSKSIQTYRTEREMADEALNTAKAQRLPDVQSSLSFSYLGNGFMCDRDFKNGMSIDMPHFGNNFALEAQQVVYSGGAISSGISLAKSSQNMAELNLNKNRQDIRFTLTGYYLDLYKLNNQKQVLQKNLELTNIVIRNMETRCTQGTALKNDIIRYEFQRETITLQLSKVTDACNIINHHLVTTLHMPTDTEIVPDSTVLGNDVKALEERDWHALATQNNIGLHQAQLNVKIGELQLKAERSELMPKVAIIAEEHFDGPITIEVPALNNNFNYWFLGVGVKYNISSLFKNDKKIKQAKLNIRRSQEAYELAQEQTENAVQNEYVNFLTAFTELNTQKKNVELADRNYDVTNNRYKNDLALLTDMLDASNTKLSADLSLVNARINLIYCYYKMKYVTHTL